MKNILTVVKNLVESKGGVSMEELRGYTDGHPISGRSNYLTIYSFDDEETNRALLVHRALESISEGVWVIEVEHNLYSDYKGISALKELIEDTLVGAKVYLTSERGVILLDRVFDR